MLVPFIGSAVLFGDHRFTFATDGERLVVEVHSPAGETFEGASVRFSIVDGRIKADLPGVDGGSFHVVNGHMDVGLGPSC